MSKESVQLLIDTTIANITNNLNQLSPPVNQTAFEAAFMGPINEAFQQTKDDEADTQLVYLSLALTLHPKALEANTAEFGLVFNTITNNDINWKYIPRRMVFDNKNSILGCLHNNMNIDPFEGDWVALSSLAMTVSKSLASLDKTRNRYYEPLKSLATYAYMLIKIPFDLGLLTQHVGSILILMSSKYMERSLLDFITNNHYDDLLEARTTRATMASTARIKLAHNNIDAIDMDDEEVILRYITRKLAFRVRNERPLQDTENMSDLEVVKAFCNWDPYNQSRWYIHIESANAEKKLHDDLKYCVYGLEHLSLVTAAFQLAWEELDKRGDVVSQLLGYLKISLVIPCLFIDLIQQLMQYALLAFLLLSSIMFLLISESLLVVINTPLYVYDGLSEAINASITFINNLLNPNVSTQSINEPAVSVSRSGLGLFQPDNSPAPGQAAREFGLR